MGNCLRRSDSQNDDYSLLTNSQQQQQQQSDSTAARPRQMGNAHGQEHAPHHNPAYSGSGSIPHAEPTAAIPEMHMRSQEMSVQHLQLNQASPEIGAGEGSSSSEVDQMKLAQRYGLIQHLPSGLYDGGKKDRECPICMVELNAGDPVRFLPCMHVYHKDCIDDWLLKHSLTCPNCMEPVDSALLNSYEVGRSPWNFDS